MTLLRRRCDVMKSHRRQNNVISTWCFCWIISYCFTLFATKSSFLQYVRRKIICSRKSGISHQRIDILPILSRLILLDNDQHIGVTSTSCWGHWHKYNTISMLLMLVTLLVPFWRHLPHGWIMSADSCIPMSLIVYSFTSKFQKLS